MDKINKSRMNHACTNCRKSHVKCDLKIPCGRCSRNPALPPCIEAPQRRRRRPSYAQQGQQYQHQQRIEVLVMQKEQNEDIVSLFFDMEKYLSQ